MLAYTTCAKINGKMELNMDGRIVDLDLLLIYSPPGVSNLINWKLVGFVSILLANLMIHE